MEKLDMKLDVFQCNRQLDMATYDPATYYVAYIRQGSRLLEFSGQRYGLGNCGMIIFMRFFNLDLIMTSCDGIVFKFTRDENMLHYLRPVFREQIALNFIQTQATSNRFIVSLCYKYYNAEGFDFYFRAFDFGKQEFEHLKFGAERSLVVYSRTCIPFAVGLFYDCNYLQYVVNNNNVQELITINMAKYVRTSTTVFRYDNYKDKPIIDQIVMLNTKRSLATFQKQAVLAVLQTGSEKYSIVYIKHMRDQLVLRMETQGQYIFLATLSNNIYVIFPDVLDVLVEEANSAASQKTKENKSLDYIATHKEIVKGQIINWQVGYEQRNDKVFVGAYIIVSK